MKRISLRGRIYGILVLLLFITLMGGLILVWYSFRMEDLLPCIINKDLAGYRTAGALENALVNQKGFVSYYFLDGDPDWLRKLGEYRQIFKERLREAKNLAENKKQIKAIDQITLEYNIYIAAKDRVIALYKIGQRYDGMKLHHEVRDRFFKILELCDIYKQIYTDKILQAGKESQQQAKNLRIIAGSAILTELILALFFAYILIKHILGPIRKLTREANRKGDFKRPHDEIKTLRLSVHELIQDFDHTHSELKKSRANLFHAEKLAIVGKLASGMAHSIRNPFTSVKMRLFSLGRSLELSETQQDDFKVISDEIRHIDTIVQNFLEFSRPPKLKMQTISPSMVVDSVIQLLEHRLKSYDVNIEVIREGMLPEIQADPEQLKEVFVNLIINACEAIGKSGSIVVREERSFVKNNIAGIKVNDIIKVSDTGPGISAALIDSIFQPFFTTKEEGTGLGLSITMRIVEEHHGLLEVESKEGTGTTFIITLPAEGI